jgi:hypothetical protein
MMDSEHEDRFREQVGDIPRIAEYLGCGEQKRTERWQMRAYIPTHLDDDTVMLPFRKKRCGDVRRSEAGKQRVAVAKGAGCCSKSKLQQAHESQLRGAVGRFDEKRQLQRRIHGLSRRHIRVCGI